MLVRRVGVRLAVVAGLSAGLLGVGAAPAMAAEDRVKVSVSSRIVAGASAGAANVSVSRRDDGCVDLRIGLSIGLVGLQPDQIRVATALDGDWELVKVSGGGNGVVVAAPTAPSKPRLCKGKSASLRFRLAFLPGAPAGQATVVAEAYDEDGKVLGRESDTTRVVSTAASPTGTPTASPTSTPPPVESPDTGGSETEATPTPAAMANKADEEDGGGSGVGTVVMILGVVMVGIGAALLAVLLRRRGREATAEGSMGGSGVYQSGSHRPSGHGPSGHGPSGHGPSGHGPGGHGPSGPHYPHQSPQPGQGYPPQPGQGYPPPAGPNYPPPAGGGETVIMPRLPR